MNLSNLLHPTFNCYRNTGEKENYYKRVKDDKVLELNKKIEILDKQDTILHSIL